MSGRTWRPAVWALVLLSTLAPSHADGNIGCLFSASLCVEGAEWCYDDFAFGKCIPIYDDEPEDGSLYQYNMNDEQLKWFEVELQRLVSRGYRWGHAYTQCVLQAMLYTLREHLDAKQVNTKICDPFVDPKLMSDSSNNAENNPEVDPDETAYIRFTPESPLSNFANEIYTPPLSAENDGDPPLPEGVEYFTNVPNNDDETPSDKLRDLLLLRDDVSEEPTVLVPFTGFRERLQQEKMSTDRDRENKMAVVRDKEKKSMQEATVNSDQQAGFDDEDRLGAHYRKSKTRITPYSSEYITGNRHSSLDAEVLSNALKKYKQTLASQNFPFEYKNVENEIPEPRIYIDEDTGEEYNPDAGSGELDPYQDKDNTVTDSEIKSKNMEYLMNYWKKIIDSKLKPQAALYAEGGPFRPDEMQDSDPILRCRYTAVDVSGENYFNSEDLPGLFYNDWGFKRRERDDVKKPGPRLDAQFLKFLYKKNVTGSAAKDHGQKLVGSPNDHIHNDFDIDPSYAYVTFKNRFGTDWQKGIEFINKVEKMLGLEKNTFTNPRVDIGEVTFKVEKNDKGLDARAVAERVDKIRDELQRETGAQILSTGIGDHKTVELEGNFQKNRYPQDAAQRVPEACRA
ncbi:Receptor-type tyrosine-protein phosphatase-like ida-1 [Eumeta japonica]|uniref:Receptor-type tyrosine-protein phosphatase-like ida-1 n=1 Tax=Eumeta variegata TaxID=151549 RepID=A0A4C1VWC1_EUMVA|nr:Receptor-type tyrosine-protein phosphatase-like ida-1 [Eumeta japonica]